MGRLLHTVAARLRKHTARLGAFHAWNKCLNHLLDLANAHVESVILDAFYAGVAGCTDPDVRKALKVRRATLCLARACQPSLQRLHASNTFDDICASYLAAFGCFVYACAMAEALCLCRAHAS